MMGDRLSAVLFALVVVFGALLVWQLRGAPAGDTPIEAAAAQDPPMVRPSAIARRIVPPLDEFTQTLERPLFARTRRPPPLEQSVASPQPLAPEMPKSTPFALELSAVVLQTDRQFALFRQAAQSSLLKAEVGQSVDGWVVSEIRADGVRLERGAERQELVLRTFKAPALPAPVLPQQINRARAAKRAAAAAAAAANKERPPRRALRRPRRRSIQRQ